MSIERGPKVVLVHWGRTGAGPRFLHDLTVGFRELGCETLVSYNRAAEISDRLERLEGAKHKVRTYKSVVGVIAAFPRSVWYGLRLARAIRGFDADLVIGTMEHLHQSLVVPFAASGRYVTVIHDARFHKGDSNLIRRLNRSAELAKSDLVVTLSQEMADLIPEGKARIASVHPVFIEPGAAAPRERRPGPHRIGFFGRLVPYKGLELLPEISAAVSRRLDIEPIRVHGSGPLAGEDYLKQPELITLDARWIPEEEIPALIRDLDVVVLPYTEASQSGVIAVALALGVPCVVTPVGGLAQQVQETGAGLVADAVTPRAVADAIVQLLEDRELYARIASAGRAAAEGPYSWRRLAGDILRARGLATDAGTAEA